VSVLSEASELPPAELEKLQVETGQQGCRRFSNVRCSGVLVACAVLCLHDSSRLMSTVHKARPVDLACCRNHTAVASIPSSCFRPRGLTHLEGPQLLMVLLLLL
jgi:hypothetical protein